MVNVTGQTGVLIIRVWTEGEDPSAIRVRVTATHDVLAGTSTEATVGTVDEACSIVEEWLSSFTASSGDPQRRDGPVTGG